MQIYTGENLDTLLALDVFKLLDMEALGQSEKDNYLAKVEQLTLQYFLQEKVGDRLKEEEMDELTQMPVTTQEEVEKFLSRVGELLPDASDLFLQASAEVKARLVKEQYQSRLSDLEELLNEESADSMEASLIKNQIAECKLNLTFVEKGDWAFVNQKDLYKNKDNLTVQGE